MGRASGRVRHWLCEVGSRVVVARETQPEEQATWGLVDCDKDAGLALRSRKIQGVWRTTANVDVVGKVTSSHD
jgi:hypothetical protein